MVVLVCTYGPQIRNITKKQEAKIKTAEIKFLRTVASYIRKGQIRSNIINEELNIFNLNAKIIKYSSQWTNHVQQM
jgi:hypothetical protein